MPANEVKQRKKTPKQNDEPEASSSDANCKDETQKVKTSSSASSSSCVDVRTIVCVLSVAACAFLSWVVLQQNERFSQMEDKYNVLHGQTARLYAMEEDVLKVSKKLAASEDDVQEALSTAALAARLQQDISVLHTAVKAIQDDENSASRELEAVNGRFLNVTETWQARLSAVHSDLVALKAEAREAHATATEGVNEAEQRSRALSERLEELEDSTKRNARALERAEEGDFKRTQDQLDWNTEQIHKLDGQISELARSEAELSSQLQEHIPKALQCEAHLPEVEEAVRSILKLTGDLSAAERRLEEVTMQVYGTEDSMLKSLNEIAVIRQELDAVHAHNSILKMKNELSVVKEAVRELTMVLRSSQVDGEEVPDAPEEEETDGWMEAEEDEEWNDFDQDSPSQPVGDDDLTE